MPSRVWVYALYLTVCGSALWSSASVARAEALEPSCSPDAALADAAAELLLRAEVPSAAQLTAAVRAAGSDAVGVRALFLPAADAPKVELWLSEMRAKSDAPLVCGDARGERARLIVASARGGTFRIEHGHARGELAPGFGRAELVLQSTQGQLTRLAAPPEALERGIALPPELHVARIQLVASGTAGPRPVAERTLLSAANAPEDPPLLLRSERQLDARGVMHVIATLREERALPALREHRIASELAGAHAQSVCEQGRVVHTLEPGLDPSLRLARAGLTARLVGETIGHADDLAAALQALWDSPSHKLALLERRFTHLGIGSALDAEGKSCLVVLLLAWPRYQGR